MRIALITPGFPKLSETFIASKALGLLRRGWDIHIVCGRSEPAEWAYFPELEAAGMRQRVHVTRPSTTFGQVALHAPLVAVRTMHRRETWRYLFDNHTSLINRLKRWYLDEQLIQLQPDLVHFEFGALAPNRMHLKHTLRCRLVVSFRGYDINYVGLEYPHYYETVWEHADALHLLSKALWERAQRRGCPSSTPYALIPPAIDIDTFLPARKPVAKEIDLVARPLRILSVGRLTWVKGYEYALQAIRHLVDQGIACQYTVIGGGDYLEAIAFARRQLGLDEIVELAGPLPRESVREHLQKTDVFLHAAVSEGFCNAVVEAQAMKVPVVCSDADGLPENVADGETGFIVPRRDPEALAEKLAILAANPNLRLRMGEAGRQRVEKYFQLDDQIAAFDALYRQVLAIHDSSAACNNIRNNEQAMKV